ncbi:ABC transporter permease [Amycolatopsis jejuensis]|uniref:ABC transporter permease n=1 Tax=Amycolatopsis jejuensis TaxID=330084 RepID=UPI00052753A0|nr:ABC transporter permease [Amycolatopsis jejuensis]
MTVSSTGRVVGRFHGAWLRVEGHWTWYRRHWLSTLYSTGLQPVLFLAAMGLGFGAQVKAGPATGGVSYLVYVAPALLVVLVGVLTGLACGSLMTALASRTFDEGQRFGLLFRFVVIPMTLFSGTFFPIDQLPLYLRWLAWISPLWHGTELSRASVLGGYPALALLGHVAYLVVLILAGWAIAHRGFYRRLVA